MLLFKGFLELRKYVDQFVFLLKIMMQDSDIPCFKEFDIEKFKSRFKQEYTEDQVFIILFLIL